MTRARFPAFRLLALAMLATACSDDPEGAILVDLRTDFVPGVEFREVDVALIPSGGTAEMNASLTANVGDDFLGGRRVGEFPGPLPVGPTTVRVRLRDPDARLIAERRVRFDHDGSTTGVTVIITRSCLGVVCPGAGDPSEATECFGARCVEPECTPDDPTACGEAECTSDADCGDIAVADCVVGACVAGACLAAVVPGACAAGEYCDPRSGCEPVPVGVDGGVPDAGCTEGAPCTDGCATGTMDCSGASPACVADGVAPSGTACRAATSVCDVEETCDGTSPDCPEDAFAEPGVSCPDGSCDGAGGCSAACMPGAPCGTGNPCAVGEIDCSLGMPRCMAVGIAPPGTECRPAVGPCDRVEACDGTSTICPVDELDTGATCRAAVGPCDRAETCGAISPACPADTFQPAGTACPIGSCDGLGTCMSGCTPGAPCGTGNPCEIGAILCSGGPVVCASTGPAPAGTVCRPAAGPCDRPETCSGSSTTCPTNGFLPSTIVCRPAVATCDIEERCPGDGPSCFADGRRSAGYVCRMASDVCDVTETCDGTSTACPSDGRQAAGFVCRGALGLCDLEEACDGASPSCPTNAFRPLGTVCMPGFDCTPASTCSGMSASCPTPRGCGPSEVCDRDGDTCQLPQPDVFCAACDVDANCGTYFDVVAGALPMDCADLGYTRACLPVVTSGCPRGTAASGGFCVPVRGVCRVWEDVFVEGSAGETCMTDPDCTEAMPAPALLCGGSSRCVIPCGGPPDCLNGFACGSGSICYLP